jgi:hypothetical protein
MPAVGAAAYGQSVQNVQGVLARGICHGKRGQIVLGYHDGQARPARC